MGRMSKKSVLKVCFGGILSLGSLLNMAFGWFRSLHWLQQNAPAFWSVLVNPAFEYLLIVMGVAFSVTGFWDMLQLKDAPTSDVLSQPTINTQAKGGGNQALSAGRDIVINQSLGEASKAPLPPPALRRSVPNLTYCGFRNTDLYLSQWDRDGAREPNNSEQRKRAIPAVVLKFENEPWYGGTGADTSDLIARIVYRLGPDTRRVDFAVWLDSSLRSHYIRVGETHEVLLLLRMSAEDESTYYMALEDKRRLNEHFSDPWSWFRQESFSTIQSAEVTLTDQRSQSRYVFDFGVADEAGNFTVLLTSSTSNTAATR
jgi:hypothetical protein